MINQTRGIEVGAEIKLVLINQDAILNKFLCF